MPRENVEALVEEVSEEALKVADAKVDDLSKTIQGVESDSLESKTDDGTNGSQEHRYDNNGSWQNPASAPAPLHTDIGQ